MDINITTIDHMTSEFKREIDIFIEKNRHSTIFHTTYWNNILINNFTDKNLTHYYLIFSDNGEIIGLFPYFANSRLNFFSNLYSPFGAFETPYGGPLHKAGDTTLNLVEALKKDHRIRRIDITTSPFLEDINFQQMTFSKEFLTTSIINLNLSKEKIWQKFNRSTKRNIKKGQKVFTVEFVDTNLEANFIDYYTHLQKNQLSNYNNIKSKGFYKKIVFELRKHGMSQMVVVKSGENFIAGSIILMFKNCVYVWNTVSNKSANNLGAGHFLNWEIIKWAKEKGYELYDFVIVDKKNFPGIAEYKLGFGGELVHFPRYRKKFFL